MVHAATNDRPTAAAGEVVVLSGSGAGNTAVAELLAGALSPSVCLSYEHFWRFTRQVWTARSCPDIDRHNELTIMILAHTACAYAAAGYQVICHGSIGPAFIDLFHTAAAGSGLPVHYVVLRPATTSAPQATPTCPSSDADDRRAEWWVQPVTNLGVFEPHALDTSHLDTKTTAATVLHGIAHGAYRLNTEGTRRHDAPMSMSR